MNASQAASLLGKLGGSARSERKTAAARLNAKKGGWPKGKKRKVAAVVENQQPPTPGLRRRAGGRMGTV